MGFWTLGCLVAATVLATPHDPPQTRSYPRGELVAPVVSVFDPRQQYVVYVPRSADLAHPAPVLYIMDYRGRGRVAAEVFVPAAERFGWILISSYNTASDVSAEPNAAAIRAMWADSHAWFAIDDRRTYLAGLSGTARLATLVAHRASASFTGIIGAAAGFTKAAPPSKQMPFLYYGTAGTGDYNYWEMRELAARLERLGVAHRMSFFDGGHDWMPPDLALDALAWMELRAMGAGLLAVDRTLVANRWARDLERFRTLQAQGLTWEASRLLAGMAADYKGLLPAAALKDASRQARALADTAAAQVQARWHERAAERHRDRISRLASMVGQAFPAGADRARHSAETTIRDLGIDALLDTARGTDEQAYDARRVLAELDVETGFYLPVAAMEAGELDRAEFYLDIAHAIRPDDPYAWYLRAAVNARLLRAADAIQAIEHAVALGWRTADALEEDVSFRSLRQRPEFRRLVNRLRDANADMAAPIRIPEVP